MQAMPRTGINMILVLTGMFNPQTKKIGRMANVKSEIIAHAEYKNVSAMITSIGTQ